MAEKKCTKTNPSFPVPDNRFDQKNEMFKRSFWDERIRPQGLRFYREAEYDNNVGFRKLDYALRFGSWGVEINAACGNQRSNHGLYAWDHMSERAKPWAEAGGKWKERPQDMARMIKKAARLYGADLVGICKIHPNFVYSHEFNLMTQEHYPFEIPEGICNAIVMAIEMDYPTMRTAPSGIQAASTGLGYSRMAYVSNLLATFIRMLGYRAIPSGNDTALSIPLAMAAGLGEFSRAGLLITKKYGPRVRLCKVLTDLPLSADSYKPFGVMEFCRVCKKCAKNCPSQAIPFGDLATEGPNISNHSGVLKWYVDCEKCFAWWAEMRMDCTTCIQVCPFNKPKGILHDATRSLIRLKNAPINHFINGMDSVMGYERKLPPESFWTGD